MHKFLRSIGFATLKSRKEYHDLITELLAHPDDSQTHQDEEGTIFVELTKNYGPGMGICVRGTLNEKGKMVIDYSFPYLLSTTPSHFEDLQVEKYADRDAYVCVCDDYHIGVSLIFYIQNALDYRIAQANPFQGQLQDTVLLSALALNGKVLLPILEKESGSSEFKAARGERERLLAAARDGDERAIETLTLEDIDTYSRITRRLENEDILSIVKSTFMPHGIEGDQYQILGTICRIDTVVNTYTKELVYQMVLNCNDLLFQVCINKKDLLGEPQIGRRFKGIIWMQGHLDFQ